MEVVFLLTRINLHHGRHFVPSHLWIALCFQLFWQSAHLLAGSSLLLCSFIRCLCAEIWFKWRDSTPDTLRLQSTLHLSLQHAVLTFNGKSWLSRIKFMDINNIILTSINSVLTENWITDICNDITENNIWLLTHPEWELEISLNQF